jgi:predicted glycosyltransferase
MGGALRCLAIASQLSARIAGASVLALTDLSILGRFRLPKNFDYVHFPSVGTNGSGGYLTPGLRSGSSAMALRRTIAATTIESFEPHQVIVDRHPLGVGRELAPTLIALRQSRPGMRVVLGLPDVIGEPGAVREAWGSSGAVDALHRLYDEVWVYGAPEVFDAVREYALPGSVGQKLVYTGYLGYQVDADAARAKALREGIRPESPLVLVSAGSGRSGFPLLDTYLDFLEKLDDRSDFQSHLVCGPFMPVDRRKALQERSRHLPSVYVNTFHANLMPYVYAASVVVATFGYNTCCELLSLAKPAVVVPSASADSEQSVRARAMAERGLVDCLEPEELGQERLGAMVLERLREPTWPPKGAIPLEGLDEVASRVVEHAPALDSRPAAQIR